MRRVDWIILVGVMAAAAPACSEDSGRGAEASRTGVTTSSSASGAGGSGAGGTGGRGAGGTDDVGGGGGAGGAGGSATSSSGAGAPVCGELLPDSGECTTCAATECCTELLACAANSGCVECILDPLGAGCDAPLIQDKLAAFGACVSTQCADPCGASPPPAVEPICAAPADPPSSGACVSLGGAIECNPVTNAPCDTAAGESCDLTESGYACYAGGNVHELCEGCGQNNDYCKGGMTCVGKCARYCCDDADCGAGGACEKAILGLPGGVGVCVVAAGGP